MRETQKEGKKLALLNKYKRAVVRVQLPDRHVIQAVFPPGAGNYFQVSMSFRVIYHGVLTTKPFE